MEAYLFDWFIVSVVHLPVHYHIRKINKEKKIVKMFQKFLGVYTLYSRSDTFFGPIYIQSMFESESGTREHTKKGKEHFLVLAYTNGSFVWSITPELPKTGHPSQASLPLCANASSLEIPPTRGWYTGNIFEGWKHEISVEVFPKGGKNT